MCEGEGAGEGAAYLRRTRLATAEGDVPGATGGGKATGPSGPAKGLGFI